MHQGAGLAGEQARDVLVDRVLPGAQDRPDPTASLAGDGRQPRLAHMQFDRTAGPSCSSDLLNGAGLVGLGRHVRPVPFARKIILQVALQVSIRWRI